jgi:hypothetical protein
MSTFHSVVLDLNVILTLNSLPISLKFYQLYLARSLLWGSLLSEIVIDSLCFLVSIFLGVTIDSVDGHFVCLLCLSRSL